MAEREQGLVFGEVAEQYDRVRPGYPRELVADLVAIAGIEPGARVLEVGSGTGKATVLFAEAGFEVVGLEPSPEMAAVAMRKLARFPNVTIEVASFEDWPVPQSSFDLVAAAQAWHWVDGEVGLPKARACLRPGGALAVFWNWDMGPRSSEVRTSLDSAYETAAPSMVKEPLKHRIGQRVAEEIEACRLFEPIERRSYPWHRRFTTAEYLDLLTTHSDHRMLPDADRRALHDAVAAVIGRHGGAITVEYVTEIYVASRR